VYPAGTGTERAGHVERGVAALIEQEAMRSGSIVVRSHDLARGIDAVRFGRPRAGRVYRGVPALIEQETVALIVGKIAISSHDLAQVAAPVGNRATPQHALHVERCVIAPIEQEAVRPSIPVPSHDLARGIDPEGHGVTRIGRAWHVNRG